MELWIGLEVFSKELKEVAQGEATITSLPQLFELINPKLPSLA